MIDTIGWIGSICFALCGVPQAWQCFRAKNADGLSSLFLALWLVGEICYIVSVWARFGWVDWMMFNYVANIFCIIVILYYKRCPK